MKKVVFDIWIVAAAIAASLSGAITVRSAPVKLPQIVTAPTDSLSHTMRPSPADSARTQDQAPSSAAVRQPEPQLQPTAAESTSLPAGTQSPYENADDTRQPGIEKNLEQQIILLREFFSMSRLLFILLILIITYVLTRFIATVLERIVAQKRRYASWLGKIVPLVTYGLWLLALAMLVVGIGGASTWGVIIVMAFAAVMFALAAQPLLRDLISGLIIAFERPFQLGNHIRIGDFYGQVKRIGLRSFQLVSPDGSVVVVPNSEITRQSVANTNPSATESKISVALLLPPDFDIEVAKEIAFEAAAVSPYIFSNKPIEVIVDEEFQSQPLTKILVRAYVFDARYENELQSDIIETARKAFQAQMPREKNAG